MKAWSTEKISVFSLVLLITGAIDSIRNLPTTALFGSSLIFFFVLSALMFLIPIALVAAELASTWSEEEGGIYNWVHHAFGPSIAFFTIWLQWVNTVVWYPTMLLFIASTFAYLINPELVQSKIYLASVILSVYWGLTFLGLSGLRASARFAGWSAVIGLLIPMTLIIFLAGLWVISGHPIAISFNWSNMIPHWDGNHSWVSLTAIMTSFLGMELAAVHVRNIDNPQRNFPLAMLYSVILILVTIISGSLAIAFVLPTEKISLVSGVMQAFYNFFQVYHLSALMPVIVIMILIGSVGSMVNWIISPAKGLTLAADHGFLPKQLYKLNKQGIPSRVLLLQATLVTLFCGCFLFFPSINAIYWLFTDLSTEIYILMYVMMFLAAIRLKGKCTSQAKSFSIPGGRVGYYATCLIGLMGCIITLIVGFFPPEQSINIGGATQFRIFFTIGIVCGILPALVFCLRRYLSINYHTSHVL